MSGLLSGYVRGYLRISKVYVRVTYRIVRFVSEIFLQY